MPKCSWCSTPVKEAGDTCNIHCYRSFEIALRGRPFGTPLDDNVVIPKDITRQPWYEAMTYKPKERGID